MAANEYYNSFNGGTPQMMNAAPASSYAPSASGTAPPPYQEHLPQGFPPGHPQAAQPPPPQNYPYNIADYKHNYDPRQQYGPSTPPPQQAQPYQHPSQSQVHFDRRPTYYSPAPSPGPYVPKINTHGGSPPPSQRHGRGKYSQGVGAMSTTNLGLRPQRSSSEPPSPYHDRRHSEAGERRRRRHHHHHDRHDSSSRSRSRSRERYGRNYDERDRDRDRDRGRDGKQKPKNAEKNTFLGAIGGSVIGDIIFPGLGTVGGALLGGWGGHEHSKKKDQRMRERSYSDRPEHPPRRSWRGHKSYEEEWTEGKKRRGEY